MKFEPLVFIRIANRNGIKLTRVEGGFMRVRGKYATWLPLLRKHKRQLMKYLDKDEAYRIQLDLFDDLPPKN
ncbi:hypothetical protein BAZMOX_133783_1 [methanotrophic endosymbiont of Bathymodiolus azoricus (Menez Gwen)]|nr:hypothetical protein BAZMOX_133783_1 [methanotrophic endosymbiont of Bathymodiolus azoricus (Menez Gwen)]